jgi:hypothetical protein
MFLRAPAERKRPDVFTCGATFIHKKSVNLTMPMLVVKQFHYISKEESQMVLESIISKAQSIVFDVGCRFANFRSVQH